MTLFSATMSTHHCSSASWEWDAHVDVQDLDRLTQERYVERVGSRYTLSEAGTSNARLEFATSWEKFTRPISAVCSRAAWCTRPDM